MLSYLSKFVAYPTHKQDSSHPRLIKFPQKTHNFEVKVNRTSKRHRGKVERDGMTLLPANSSRDCIASWREYLYKYLKNSLLIAQSQKVVALSLFGIITVERKSQQLAALTRHAAAAAAYRVGCCHFLFLTGSSPSTSSFCGNPPPRWLLHIHHEQFRRAKILHNYTK